MSSPAKITLQLRILRRRSDGYHDVRLALAPVSLYDTVHLQPLSQDTRTLAVESAQGLGAPAQNLVLRAAEAFREALGRPCGLALRLTKRVPAGAGLGGGSANAAATLVALNKWAGSPLGPDTLHAIAAGLGADVPFFLEPQPAWAEGIGERLTPIPELPRLALLVVWPPLEIATGAAYRGCKPEDTADAGPLPPLDSAAAVLAALHNTFEETVLPRYPVLGEIAARLRAAGARGVALSGSGAAVFGVFTDTAARDAALARLQGPAAGHGWRLLPCHTLRRHRYDLVF